MSQTYCEGKGPWTVEINDPSSACTVLAWKIWRSLGPVGVWKKWAADIKSRILKVSITAISVNGKSTAYSFSSVILNITQSAIHEVQPAQAEVSCEPWALMWVQKSSQRLGHRALLAWLAMQCCLTCSGWKTMLPRICLPAVTRARVQGRASRMLHPKVTLIKEEFDN